MRSRGARLRAGKRSGAAAVEFALVAPVLFLIVFGAVEFGRAIMVLDLLSHAARSGCRVGVLPGNGNPEMQSAVTTALAAGGINGASAPTIDVMPLGSTAWTSPGDAGAATSGDAIRVTVSVPYQNVSWLGFSWFINGNTSLSSAVVMSKE